MDRAFRTIVTRFGGSLVEAATMCSTTPARELGLTGFGVIAVGAVADLVVLDRGFRVVRTFIGGEQVLGPRRAAQCNGRELPRPSRLRPLRGRHAQDDSRTGSVLGISVLALGSAACSIDVRGEGIVTREEKRFTVTGAPDLNLRTFDGSIQVKSWDRNEVLVEIERRGPDAQTAEALVVNATQDGNRIVVEAPGPATGRTGFTSGPGSRRR